jgi:hypothetical protein
LRGSLFCEVREAKALPLCGYYASAMQRVLQLFHVSADVRVSQCRAESPGRRGCLLSVSLSRRATGDAVAA